MPAPKSILKKPSQLKAGSAGPSQPQGSKLKQTVKLARKAEKFKGPDIESDSEGNESGFEGPEEDEEGDDVEMNDDEEMSTGDEIDLAKSGGGDGKKKAIKRKRSTTTASTFGSTLTSLLTDELATASKKRKTTTPNPILALSSKRAPPSAASRSLELKAARLLKVEKEEKEDKARIRDVVEGWAPADPTVGSQEFERGLRKIAQRGVIKLFNAILVASKNAEESTTSIAKTKLKEDGPKNKREKDNILGRGGKEDVLTKESFLDLVRKGSAK
ncbi:hypothetical protein P7C73_g4409, partial [Tremellales sp. Uapishka_1]